MKTLPRTLVALAAGVVLGIGFCVVALSLLRPSALPSKGLQAASAPARGSSTKTPAARPMPSADAVFPRVPATPREFAPLKGAHQATWEQLEKEFWAATDEAVRLDLLDRIEKEFYTPALLGLLKRLFELPDSATNSSLRERGIELLSGNLSPEILPLLRLGSQHEDEDLRARALLAAAQVRSPETAGFFTSYFSDPSSFVRLSVFDALEHQTEQTRHQVFEKALTAVHADVALHAVGELQVSASHANLPVLIGGLNAPLREVREAAADALEFLFDQRFDSAAQAAGWWLDNQKRYDENLVEKN